MIFFANTLVATFSLNVKYIDMKMWVQKKETEIGRVKEEEEKVRVLVYLLLLNKNNSHLLDKKFFFLISVCVS